MKGFNQRKGSLQGNNNLEKDEFKFDNQVKYEGYKKSTQYMMYINKIGGVIKYKSSILQVLSRNHTQITNSSEKCLKTKIQIISEKLPVPSSQSPFIFFYKGSNDIYFLRFPYLQNYPSNSGIFSFIQFTNFLSTSPAFYFSKVLAYCDLIQVIFFTALFIFPLKTFVKIHQYQFNLQLLQMKIRNRITMILILFLFFGLVYTQDIRIKQSPCPLQYQIGSVISSRITVASRNSLVPFVRGQDVQCYNYSLPYQFSRVPEIAFSIHDFEAEPSNDLFFSIKPIQSESLAFVPMLIRTHWKYTQWNKISFSLLAEDRNDFEIGYYQVDSGSLGGCEAGKNINVLLPFRSTQFYANVNHNVFLHGFQISTQLYKDNMFSPFDIQILQTNTNSSGITVIISVTSITQVHAIHMSYVAWISTDLTVVNGNYILQQAMSGQISHIPQNNIGRNYARIYGITGFVINYNSQGPFFETIWTGSKFVFNFDSTQPFVQYLSYQYIFFLGSECSNCPNYPYIHDGRCVQVCPDKYFATDREVCIFCGDGHYWNGTACVKQCPEGQTLNSYTNQCQCPIGTHWNEAICITCTGGRVFISEKNKCQCPAGTIWNGYGCAKKSECQDGRQWNIFKFMCQCPIDSVWNGTFCVKVTSCSNGRISDGHGNCICPDGTHWNQEFCQPNGCVGGQVYSYAEQRCVCQPGYNFNGTLCLLCINGQTWNERNRTCQCEAGFMWNGNYCSRVMRCSGNRVYNEQYQQCICPNNTFWNGYTCMVQPDCCCGQTWNQKTFECDCPESFHWDDHNCVLCINGQTWSPSQKECICRQGTQWNGHFCAVIQQCFGGSIWNQNTWSCQCPADTVWNGRFCIQNSCSGGQVWDNSQRKCVCLGRQIIVEGRCILPEYLCINGKQWDGVGCVCPRGTYEKDKYCIDIPICQGNQVWSGINLRCECLNGFIWIQNNQNCGDPSCPEGERWNGFGCVKISCPPNSYFNGTQCICPAEDKCKPWEIFDGQRCVVIEGQCPHNTEWNGTHCDPILGKCPSGFYGSGQECYPIPQRCTPPTIWRNDRCVSDGSNCPKGTYFRSGHCLPYVQCQNGQTWDQNLINCVCPEGTEWNGDHCLACSGGKIWEPFVGCKCPTGYFFFGTRCDKVQNQQCQFIPNSFWDGFQCLCHDGYQIVGLQCVCESNVIVGNRCQRCAHLQNSEWKYGECRCKPGYTKYASECLGNQVGSDSPDSCNIGTFYDQQQRRCLPCPAGCLTCTSSYTCDQCKPEFRYDIPSELCVQLCGDGKKFVYQCDDGNNVDGDGCSMDCQIEPGYACRGGSPQYHDDCVLYLPPEATITRTGYIRYRTKIVINLKLDYMSRELLQSVDCSNECSNVLEGKIILGEKAISVRSKYIAGTSYSFSMQIEFGRNYIGQFTVEISINPIIANKYYTAVLPGNPTTLDINPAYLSYKDQDEL